MTTKILCRACQLPMTTIGASRLHAGCDIDPDILATELFSIIEQAIAQQPRTLQTSIGPSEIGNPCDRRIGYKLAGTQPVNGIGAINWKAFVGTAVHEMLADILGKDEIRNLEADDFTATRWHVEERVKPGLRLNGDDVEGSCDLFDAATGTVWDWKTTTRNKIREQYRPHGVGDQYEIQAQLYGAGWAAQGYDVRTVGVIFLTRDAEFTDRHVWHTPYDPKRAAAALERVRGIHNAITGLGAAMAIPLLDTAPAYCRFCPYFQGSGSNDSRSCAGNFTDKQAPATLSELLGA
jgi:hypothetical protein